MSGSDYDLETELADNGDDNILTPLGILDYKELASGNSNNADFVTFKITIEGKQVDKLTVKITGSSGVLLQKELDASMRTVGTHQWKWDGYDNNGILNTRTLKGNVTVEFVAQLGGDSKSAEHKLSIMKTKTNWLDITINKRTKTITVDLRLNLKDGGAKGVGELPPQDVRNNFPQQDPRSQRHIRVRGFQRLSMMLLAGMKQYWSRQISVPGGDTYTVTVNATMTTRHAMDDIAIVYNTNARWLRSSNPGKVRGVISFFGNLVKEKVAYNIGWIQYKTHQNTWQWNFDSAAEADRDFTETAAHELGHEILSAYGGAKYSYTHRGSSTLIKQEPLPLAKGGVSYPATGEIGLMKYYNGRRPRNSFSRILASEQDVKSFVWLARVQVSE